MGTEEAYDEALRRFDALPAGEAGALQSFYESDVMPYAIERIRVVARRAGFSPEPVDLLLVTAGRQPYSMMLSLALTPARFIAFLCTDESLSHAERAWATLAENTPSAAHEYARVDPADPLSVYREVLRIFQRRRPSSTLVDITSGTKAMTAAASAAAVVIEARQRYVESFPTKHRGWLGREQPHELPHPLVVMGDLKRREGERLFNCLALDQAEVIFTDLHQRGAPGYRYRERARLAQAYIEADALRFAQAAAAFTGEDIARLRSTIGTTDPICALGQRLTDQRARFLELAAPTPPDETLLRFLVAYARRRATQGLYDAAALVHYRTIELCIAARLAARGVDVNDVREESLEKAADCSAPELLARYNRTRRESEYRLSRWPVRLGLAQGWMVLYVLDDPLSTCTDTKRLFGQVKARNESIFAHGRKPLSATTYKSFAALAERIRSATAVLQGWSLPDPDPEFDFVTFDDPV